MNRRAEEVVFKAGKELDKAKAKLESFETIQQVPSYFEGSPKEFFLFLTQQVKDREAALEKREAALINLAKAPQTSATKQSQYKGMSVESSCRKFLDALAKKISELYDFATVSTETLQ